MDFQYLKIKPDSEPQSFERILLKYDTLQSMISDYNKRDLYFIDNNIQFDVSSLVIKKECIICKLDNFKTIIFTNQAYVSYSDAFFNKKTEWIMFSQTQQKENKIFHLNILEFLLMNVLDNLEDEYNIIFTSYGQLRHSTNNNKDFKDFVALQSNLLKLEYRVKELHTITEELVKNKDDLQELTFEKCEVDLVDNLIDNYDLKLEDIYNDISRLVREIENIQRDANIKLARERNKLARMTLKVSVVSLTVQSLFVNIS